ncbi:MAG: DNA mismatch repair endonuclease MutL, partial [Chitinophaga sp.]
HANQAHVIDKSSNLQHWKELYGEPSRPDNELPPQETPHTHSTSTASVIDERWQEAATDHKVPVQVHQQFILSQIKSGFILIDKRAAHERILYERYQKALSEKPMATQQSLFPQTLELLPADALIITEMLPDLQALGYDLEPFGQHTFVVRGTPADIQTGNEQASIEGLLEQFKHFSNELKLSRRERLVRSIARNNAIPPGKILGTREMQNLIDELFACATPNISPGGRFTFISFKLNDLEKMFERGM